MRELMLIMHFLGLGLGLGTAFAHAFLGAATSKMQDDEKIKFRLHTLALAKMGNIGLVLLVVSGVFLIIPFWDSLLSLPLLMLKLALVLVLIVFITLINLWGIKAAKSESAKHLSKMERLGKLMLLLSVSIVIIAVCVFH